MGVYLPYVNMPETRVKCPLNYGGTCIIAPVDSKSDLCIGLTCGRIMPLPNKINCVKIKPQDFEKQ